MLIGSDVPRLAFLGHKFWLWGLKTPEVRRAVARWIAAPGRRPGKMMAEGRLGFRAPAVGQPEMPPHKQINTSVTCHDVTYVHDAVHGYTNSIDTHVYIYVCVPDLIQTNASERANPLCVGL